MKSMIYTGTAPKDTFCLVCTNRATKMVVLGKIYTNSIDVDQFFICDECAEKISRKLMEECDD